MIDVKLPVDELATNATSTTMHLVHGYGIDFLYELFPLSRYASQLGITFVRTISLFEHFVALVLCPIVLLITLVTLGMSHLPLPAFTFRVLVIPCSPFLVISLHRSPANVAAALLIGVPR